MKPLTYIKAFVYLAAALLLNGLFSTANAQSENTDEPLSLNQAAPPAEAQPKPGHQPIFAPLPKPADALTPEGEGEGEEEGAESSSKAEPISESVKKETEKPAPALSAEEKEARAIAARETAELRIEEDMVTMTNLIEALAKNLGQIHYLRTLCFGQNDQKWREYASKMMTLEAETDTQRKQQLVRAFNAGYYLEKKRHTACDPNVSVDVAALAENGRHISSMLGDPFRE